MASQLRQQNRSTLPSLRKNKHFRIKSASREKLLPHQEVMSVKLRHKVPDQTKRIFSQSRHKKSGSVETTIKVRIVREELDKRLDKFSKDTVKKKPILYQCARTQDNYQGDELRETTRIKTMNFDENFSTLHRIAQVCDPIRMMPPEGLEQCNKVTIDSSRFKKVKNSSDSKEPKGKYRCRVNQYIFQKKKSHPGRGREQEQGTIDQFWKNVNESLILAGREEEMSKDLQEFVFENFITE